MEENGDGTFLVRVVYLPDEGFGSQATCLVGGTVGEPTVEMAGLKGMG
ncbi:MAG: hypothetical protein ABWY54_03770 [Glaciihabitans sp.]